jgi:translation initiation factor IF-2
MNVKEFAKKIGRSEDSVVDKAQEFGYPVFDVNDDLDEDCIELLEEYFENAPEEEVVEEEVVEEEVVEEVVETDDRLFDEDYAAETEALDDTVFVAKKKKKNKKADQAKKAEQAKQARKDMYKNRKKLVSNIPSKQGTTETASDQVGFKDGMTVGEFADALGVGSTEVIKQLMMLGIMASINNSLSFEQAELVAIEHGKELIEVKEVSETNFEDIEFNDSEADLEGRPPVITIMGHVDHGKTTLLDTIRKANVADGEAGGITQHIGAYQIEHNNQKFTFLDTPGHEAFTAMRARGAQVTDIVIIVVAADDGVMPQTREAIDHAKAAGVPTIVAVNKMDLPAANPDRVMNELARFDLVPEAWGGDTIFAMISAKQGEGIDELLDSLSLVAEMEELKANPNRYAMGSVVEAELDKGKGVIATLLVQNGTLRIGDPVVVGNSYGKIRKMTNDLGEDVVSALPSTPVAITGLNAVPAAGDKFMAFETEKKARAIGEERITQAKLDERKSSAAMSLDDLFDQIQEGDVKEIKIILKSDVQGSAEAVKASLERVEVEGVKVKVIRSGVGGITEGDVLLASASNALIIGFNVRPNATTRKKAEAEGIEIRLYNIIYKAVEELEAAMKGMLDPIFHEVVTGQVLVRDTFKVSKVGTIAGGYVTDGFVTRHAGVRLIRDSIVVFEGKLSSLKRFKDDVKEVKTGYECGMTIENFNDIKVDDIIEAFVEEEIKRK